MKKTRLLPLLSILLLASCETGISSAEPSTGSSSVSEPSANDPSSVLPSSTEPSTPEPSTPTPPPEPVTPTVDLVAESIQTLIDSTLLSYTYSIRVYQDNYITGDVIQNMRETTIIDSYVNAYDGIVTTEEIEGVLEPTTTSTQTARVASYRLDEESYIRGLISDGANHDGDFAEILEINRYSDVNSMEARIFQPVQRSALSAFSDPEAYYPADMGFTLGETVIEETDTSFVVTISGSAEEDPIRYYAREEDEIAVEIDKYTAEVRSITITTFLYDMGYTGDDKEEGANNYQIASLTDLVTGERQEGNVPELDLDLLDESQITTNIPEIQEVAEGEIPEDKVRDILANIQAYSVGTNKDEYTIETDALTDATTWEPLGPATGVGTAAYYEDETYEQTITYTFEDESMAPQTQSIVRKAEDDGVHVESNGQTGILEPTSILAWADYFTPGPVTATGSNSLAAVIMYEAASQGFGEIDTGFSIINRELIEATKTGNTMVIHFTSNMEMPNILNSDKEIKLTFVDDFLVKAEGTAHDYGTYMTEATVTEVHNLTKGDPLPRE